MFHTIVLILIISYVFGDTFNLIPFSHRGIDSNGIILTNGGSQAANTWSPRPFAIPAGFTATFSIQAISNGGTRADGFSFYLSTTPNVTGASGGSLAKPPGSVGFTLDYFNDGFDFYTTTENTDTYYLNTNGGVINDNKIDVTVIFDCTTTTVYLRVSASFTAYYPSTGTLSCSNTPYYFGVGAATGGFWQTHYVTTTMTVNPNPGLTTSRLTTNRLTTSPLTTNRLTTSPMTSTRMTTSQLTSSPITTSPMTTSLTTNEITTYDATSLQITSGSLSTSESSAVTSSQFSSDPVISSSSSSSSNRSYLIIAVVVSLVGFALIFTITAVIIVLVRKSRKRRPKTEELKEVEVRSNTERTEAEDQKEYFRNYTIPYDKLTFGSKIGEGSFGEVYVGKYRKTEVAIKKLKVISDEIINEAKLLKQVPAHPNVVLFRGVTLEPDPVCIVTDFCAGGSLYTWLKNNHGKLTENQMISIACDIAKGMLHLHEGIEGVEIIHRDLAARNILLKKDGTCAVSDFGLARTKSKENTIGNTKNTIGPIKWMAPESLLSGRYSRKTDIYAFGIVVYEIVTQNDPWPGETLASVIRKVTGGEKMKIPSIVPNYFRDIMLMCWDSDPMKRPTFDDIIEKLEAAKVVTSEPIEEISPETVYNLSPGLKTPEGQYYTNEPEH